MATQQGFVFVQTQNQNASCSLDSSSVGDFFSYFSVLNIKTKHSAADAETAEELLRARLEKFVNSPPPIGLKLTKTSYLQKSIEEKLNEKTKKLKAENFSMCSLRIGSFMVVAIHEGDLVAKCYYATRKLVWEILENCVKNKIEIQWQNIVAMRAIIKENRPGILEIELDKAPAFFREAALMPLKQTRWNLSKDFTGGQASKYRRHYLQFPPGVLDKHYEKLIQYDKRLMQLSQRPFPSLHSPYFDPQLYQGTTDFSFGQALHRSKTNPASQQQQQPILVLPVGSTQVQQFGNTMPWSLMGIYNSTSPASAINNQRLQAEELTFWGQRLDGCEISLARDPMSCATDEQLHGPGSNYEELSDIEKILLAEDCDPETFWGERQMANVYAGLLVEENPWLNAGVNSWDALTNGLEEQYSAINSNANHMHEDLSDYQGGLFYPQQSHYIPPLQVFNVNSEIHVPGTLHPPTTPK